MYKMTKNSGSGNANPATGQSKQQQRVSVVELGSKQYLMGKVIGEGTYSKVCLATLKDAAHTADNMKQVACKIINRRQAGTEFIKKFLPRELDIVRILCHPNIVSMLDIVEANHCVYMFMSYCRHGDLLEYIRGKGPLSEKRSRYFFKQIVSAVSYLHDMDIAHRDLKCENIFLTGKNNIKVGDFGFARFCRSEKTGNRVLSNTFCGSAAYAAPEIIQGSRYNPKMYDIWSLGCILYIMLTAQMPFDDSNIKKMLKFQQNRVICFCIFYNMKLANPLQRLLCQLLEPDVTRRMTINQVVGCEWLMTDGKTKKRVLKK